MHILVMWFALSRTRRLGEGGREKSIQDAEEMSEPRKKVLQINAAVKGDWFCYCKRYIVATIWTG
jgi:hypothetical protein